MGARAAAPFGIIAAVNPLRWNSAGEKFGVAAIRRLGIRLSIIVIHN